MTNLEIEDNQLFIEACAKDYRNLAKTLIHKLAEQFKTEIHTGFPLLTFNKFKDDRQLGMLGHWKYFIHGYHCRFEDSKTGQKIEVPLIFGQEFGILDPYFFMEYLKTTPAYQPLNIQITDDYKDGEAILEKMISLKRFEKISSNIEGIFGLTTVDRESVDIQIFMRRIK